MLKQLVIDGLFSPDEIKYLYPAFEYMDNVRIVNNLKNLNKPPENSESSNIDK
jgi:hypothetical protein